MQKISLICSIILILGLEHFTHKEDYKQIEQSGQKVPTTNR